MLNRYEDADDGLVEVFLDVLEERFPSYQHLSFKLLFDLKKRISKGNVVLASIEVASPKIRHFTKNKKNVDGYDYVVVVDRKAWELSSEKDKKRILSHELRHVLLDDKGKCKIIGHEINDFYMEVRLNADDPEWARRLCVMVADVYQQEKELSKGGKE